MGRLWWVGAFLLLVFPLSARAASPEAGKKRFALGVDARIMGEVDLKDAKAALEVWVKELAHKAGFMTRNLPDGIRSGRA